MNLIVKNMEKVTEKNGKHKGLDTKSIEDLVRIINDEDKNVALAVQQKLPEIAHLIEIVVSKLEIGGRLFYFGSGTSGRLGILDASECPPTFGVSYEKVIGLIAGGDDAIRKAVEHAEDDINLASKELIDLSVSKNDIVIGISASGSTPYVLGGLSFCKKAGITCAALSCNPGSEIGRIADYCIEVVVGPEVVRGSTRMKAGTAQKMVLNMISTASMIALGHVKDNLMVDMKLSNSKLKTRGTNMLVELTGLTADEASVLLEEHQSVRNALDYLEAKDK
jgi:N-acetylmuramic acid 6-phosphate etherase